MPEIKIDISDIEAKFWEDVEGEKALFETIGSVYTGAEVVKQETKS